MKFVVFTNIKYFINLYLYSIRWARQQDKKIFRQIMPFVQAMENLRYTALDQKNYMFIKAIADNQGANVFENIRWRFHQEDIL